MAESRSAPTAPPQSPPLTPPTPPRITPCISPGAHRSEEHQVFTKHTDLLITARSAVSSASGMAQIPSPLRVPHQLQFCPPSRDASRGPQASWPSGEALGATLAAPRNVWDTRPGSELSSGFSLRLTHCPPPPQPRALSVIGHCPARDCAPHKGTPRAAA